MQNKAEYCSDLIKNRKQGYTLPSDFYLESWFYERELEQIFFKDWIFAGHTCEIPNPGDFLTLELERESVIISRSTDKSVHAFYNNCRHRGTRVCSETRGNAQHFVCPYHQWTYNNAGGLTQCKGMHPEFKKSEHGLRKVELRELEGLLFVSLAENPPSFEKAFNHIAPLLKPQGLNHAKMAKIEEYEIDANWKIVWENNRECFHCNVNHPQYIKANYDHINVDDIKSDMQERIDMAVKRNIANNPNTKIDRFETGLTPFPDVEKDLWYLANRTPMQDGYLTESMDGKLVAPLMGDYKSPDIGTLRIRTIPTFWCHASCDHAVTTQVMPKGMNKTALKVYWMVDKNAVEGKDYHLETLQPFWKLTSEQDWDLCMAAQKGVQSKGYIPGQLSPYKEYNLEAFFKWYIHKVQG